MAVVTVGNLKVLKAWKKIGDDIKIYKNKDGGIL